jgi:alkaline phosphatase
MHHPKKIAAGLGAVAVLGFSVPFATGGDHGPHGVKPKNVILFIGDGMGDSEVTSARYYQYGAKGRLNVDKLPVSGFQTHWSVKPDGKPDYAPDSASTGTMWATGQKTIDERISQGPSAAETIPGKNLVTILEKAQKAGKKTGNVSTAEITDATPAVLASHMSLRGCQGPEDTAEDCTTETKAAGGLGSIAEQQVDNGFDVTLGGARARYEQPLVAGGTETVVDYAKSKNFKYVTSKTDLAAVTGLAPGQKLLGLFNRRRRGAAHGLVREDADLHALHHGSVAALQGRRLGVAAPPAAEVWALVRSGFDTVEEENRCRTRAPSLARIT